MIPQSLVSFKEAISSDHPATASESDTSTYTLDPEDDDSYYTVSHGRRIQTENNIYLLPYDSEERERQQLLHSLCGELDDRHPSTERLTELLSQPLEGEDAERPFVVDVGAGFGLWAESLANTTYGRNARITGLDIVPCMPRDVPVNVELRYELWDIDEGLPQELSTVAVVNARYILPGLSDHHSLICDAARVLFTGGLLCLAEPSYFLHLASGEPIPRESHPRLYDWWQEYRISEQRRHIDVYSNSKVEGWLRETRCFGDIATNIVLVPLTSEDGDSQQMQRLSDLARRSISLLIPALRPAFYRDGLSEAHLESLISDAAEEMNQMSDSQRERVYMKWYFWSARRLPFGTAQERVFSFTLPGDFD